MHINRAIKTETTLTRCIAAIAVFFIVLMSGCNNSVSKNTAGKNADNKSEDKAASTKATEPLSLSLKDHDLTNKIWDINDQQFVTREQLLRKILDSDYILLGETHDNISHHQGQIWVINELLNAKKKVGIAFEMISRSQAESADLNTFTNSDELIKHLETEETGWQYPVYYKEIFDAVINSKYAIYPANISRDSLMSVLRKGGQPVPDEIQKLLDANPLSEKPKETLKEEIIKSHCGVANEGMVAAMTNGQRIRDAVMAEILLSTKASSGNAMVLIAGSGHIRNDRAVPMFLKNEDKNSKTVSIAWLEVDNEAKTVEQYMDHWKDREIPFDFAWFTPQVDRPDPCEEMRRMHEQHSKQAAVNK